MNLSSVFAGVALAPLVALAQTYYYEKLPGGANDVGVGAGVAWIVGRGASGSNTDVYRWNGAGFEIDGGAKGMSITVGPDGLPWLVAADGSIYRKSATAWQKLTGKGLDIAAGADGSVWLIGWPGDPVDFPTANGAIYVWSGTTWTAVGGSARRIAVDPTGAAWIVSGSGDIFRRSGNAWLKLPGRGSDIACGPDGSVWLTGYVAGGLSNRPLYHWNGTAWDQQIGSGIRLAAGADGLPWLAASNGDLYRLHELKAPQLTGSQLSHAAGSFQVTIATQTGVTYALLYKPDWSAPAWLTAETFPGNGLNRTLRDAAAGGPQRLYRVEVSIP